MNIRVFQQAKVVSKEQTEDASQDAVQPLWEHPEEQDDKDEAYPAACLRKPRRRLPTRDNLVECKYNCATIERIDGQDVQHR